MIQLVQTPSDPGRNPTCMAFFSVSAAVNSPGARQQLVSGRANSSYR
jgi:hypothetical protein